MNDFRARNSPGLLIPVLLSINGKFKYLPKLFEKCLEPNLLSMTGICIFQIMSPL